MQAIAENVYQSLKKDIRLNHHSPLKGQSDICSYENGPMISTKLLQYSCDQRLLNEKV